MSTSRTCNLDWCGKCYENIRGRAAHRGHRSYRSARPPSSAGSSGMKRPSGPASVQGSPGGVMVDSGFARMYPVLASQLSETSWDDGSSREVSTLLLFVEGGRWKACLSERSTGRVGFLSQDTLAGLLISLEGHLVAEDLDWRQSRQSQSQKGKRS